MPTDGLQIRAGLRIPESELHESTSRAGGAGGQHVNKTATKVTLRWSLRHSKVLTATQRQRLRQALRSRLTQDGELVIQASSSRSQLTNRLEARERLVELIVQGLKTQKKRRATRPTRASKERRLKAKKQRGRRKAERRVSQHD